MCVCVCVMITAHQLVCQTMAHYGDSFSVNHFTSLIEAWARNNNFDKAESWLHKMKGHGYPPDVKTYTTLLS